MIKHSEPDNKKPKKFNIFQSGLSRSSVDIVKNNEQEEIFEGFFSEELSIYNDNTIIEDSLVEEIFDNQLDLIGSTNLNLEEGFLQNMDCEANDLLESEVVEFQNTTEVSEEVTEIKLEEFIPLENDFFEKDNLSNVIYEELYKDESNTYKKNSSLIDTTKSCNTDKTYSDSIPINTLQAKNYRKFSNINNLEKYLQDFIESCKYPLKRKGYELYKSDLIILMSQKWLNDKLINIYMELLQEDNKDIYVFSTYFYTSLSKHGIDRVKGYTDKKNLFIYKLLFFPVHMGNHWIFLCFDTKKSTLEYRDSFLGRNYKVENDIINYLKFQYKLFYEDCQIFFSVYIKSIELQHNGYDCGVFVLMYAKTKLENGKYFKHKMDVYRKVVLHEIISDKILYKMNDPM